MREPSVRCAECGAPIDEPPSTAPGERRPCSKCGSTRRNISLSASDTLRLIDEAYAETTAASNQRIQELSVAQAKAAISREGSFTVDAVIVEAGVASAEATAHDATVKTESAISAELTVEREHLIQAAIRTLIETVTVAQAESARAAEKLNGLTVELVQWTRIIGSATIVAVVVGIAALAFAIYIAANPQPGP